MTMVLKVFVSKYSDGWYNINKSTKYVLNKINVLPRKKKKYIDSTHFNFQNIAILINNVKYNFS